MCPHFHMLNRQTVSEKLTAYLNNTVSKQEIYEWALSSAVSKDFEEITAQDPLLKTAVNAMIEMNHSDLRRLPTRKALEYYRRCLAGELEFIPLEAHKELHKLNIPDIPEERKTDTPLRTPLIKLWPQMIREWKYLKDTILTARIYVIIFAVCSLAVQISSILSPGFMQIGLWVPARWQAFLDAFPHLVYAYVVLMPPQRFVPTRMFVLALPLLIIGVVFYWTISWMILMKLSLSWIFILALLPFTVIPALLALFLVIMAKLRLK